MSTDSSGSPAEQSLQPGTLVQAAGAGIGLFVLEFLVFLIVPWASALDTLTTTFLTGSTVLCVGGLSLILTGTFYGLLHKGRQGSVDLGTSALGGAAGASAVGIILGWMLVFRIMGPVEPSDVYDNIMRDPLSLSSGIILIFPVIAVLLMAVIGAAFGAVGGAIYAAMAGKPAKSQPAET